MKNPPRKEDKHLMENQEQQKSNKGECWFWKNRNK